MISLTINVAAMEVNGLDMAHAVPPPISEAEGNIQAIVVDGRDGQEGIALKPETRSC